MVLSKRRPVSSKRVGRGNYHERRRRLSSNSTQALPIRFASRRDSDVEADTQVRKVNPEFESRCRYHTAEPA